MKFILTATLVAFVSLTNSAQIVPKSRVIGVKIGAASQYFPNGSSLYSSSTFNFQPSFGKFLNEKWLFSAGPEYYYSSMTSTQTITNSRLSTHTVGANVGMTRFIPMFEKLYFTVGGSIYTRIGFIKNETTEFDGTTNSSRDEAGYGGLSILPGFAYFLNHKWMLTAGFGYLNYDVSSNGQDGPIHKVNFNLSTSSLGFGFKYILGAKN